MTGFLGEYEVTLDGKGRFLLPGALRKKLDEEDKSLVISRGFDKCLIMYPLKTWEILIERIGKLNDFDPKVRKFKLLFLGGATEVELDSAGRMLVPPSLKEYAGLSKDVMLASNIDKITIWDSGKYKQFFEEETSEDFSKLGAELMSDVANKE